MYSVVMISMNITDARARLPELVKKVNASSDPIYITVKGEAKAIVMSVDEMESWQETMEILAIPGALESIREGEKDIKAGRGVPLEELC